MTIINGVFLSGVGWGLCVSLFIVTVLVPTKTYVGRLDFGTY